MYLKKKLCPDELSAEVKPNLEVTNGLELKRKVGLFSGVALIVGNMIGSIIYKLDHLVQK
jgi:hypothetical protein